MNTGSPAVLSELTPQSCRIWGAQSHPQLLQNFGATKIPVPAGFGLRGFHCPRPLKKQGQRYDDYQTEVLKAVPEPGKQASFTN